MDNRVYNALPTCSLFHKSDSFVRGLMGPVGSGKSVACCMEILQRSMRQSPNRLNLRKSRWAIIRNTYGELKTTTLKTWQDWVPVSWCKIVYDMPIRGHMSMPLGDGTCVDLEVWFIALDRPEDMHKLLSLELTGAWINEAREIPKELLDGLTMRVGRYPSKHDGGSTWSGVIMDTNPPDTDHWWYHLAEESTPQNWSFFVQPPALIKDSEGVYHANPRAENVSNHSKGYGYYFDMLPGKTMEWIKVYVLGEYGAVMSGKSVYPEYNDDFHCSRSSLHAYTNLPLLCGFDFGLTPACCFGQLTAHGGLRILGELVSTDMGMRQFMRDVFIPYVSRVFPEWYNSGNLCIIGDPAGQQRAQADDSLTCFDIISQFGLRAEPAESNSFIARREAVAHFMTCFIDSSPAFLLSSECKYLRKGMLGGYHYKRIQVTGEARFRDVPDKNIYSHVQDALQYLALKARSGNLKDMFDSRIVYEDSDLPDGRRAGEM